MRLWICVRVWIWMSYGYVAAEKCCHLTATRWRQISLLENYSDRSAETFWAAFYYTSYFLTDGIMHGKWPCCNDFFTNKSLTPLIILGAFFLNNQQLVILESFKHLSFHLLAYHQESGDFLINVWTPFQSSTECMV